MYRITVDTGNKNLTLQLSQIKAYILAHVIQKRNESTLINLGLHSLLNLSDPNPSCVIIVLFSRSQ